MKNNQNKKLAVLFLGFVIIVAASLYFLRENSPEVSSRKNQIKVFQEKFNTKKIAKAKSATKVSKKVKELFILKKTMHNGVSVQELFQKTQEKCNQAIESEERVLGSIPQTQEEEISYYIQAGNVYSEQMSQINISPFMAESLQKEDPLFFLFYKRAIKVCHPQQPLIKLIKTLKSIKRGAQADDVKTCLKLRIFSRILNTHAIYTDLFRIEMILSIFKKEINWHNFDSLSSSEFIRHTDNLEELIKKTRKELQRPARKGYFKHYQELLSGITALVNFVEDFFGVFKESNKNKSELFNDCMELME